MAYCTEDDMRRRYGDREIDQLLDRDHDGMPDPGVIDTAIADAEAEINSYLAVRYTIPLATTPDTINRVACEIARFRLYDNRVTEEVLRRYELAIRWLRDVRDGKAMIAEATADTAAPSAQVRAPAQVFTDDELGKMP